MFGNVIKGSFGRLNKKMYGISINEAYKEIISGNKSEREFFKEIINNAEEGLSVSSLNPAKENNTRVYSNLSYIMKNAGIDEENKLVYFSKEEIDKIIPSDKKSNLKKLLKNTVNIFEIVGTLYSPILKPLSWAIDKKINSALKKVKTMSNEEIKIKHNKEVFKGLVSGGLGLTGEVVFLAKGNIDLSIISFVLGLSSMSYYLSSASVLERKRAQNNINEFLNEYREYNLALI